MAWYSGIIDFFEGIGSGASQFAKDFVLVVTTIENAIKWLGTTVFLLPNGVWLLIGVVGGVVGIGVGAYYLKGYLTGVGLKAAIGSIINRPSLNVVHGAS